MSLRASLYVWLLLLLAFAARLQPPVTSAQTSAPVVYVITIDGVIDLGIAPFLQRTIEEAKEAGAAAVLLDINTLGGRVDAAVAMRDTLLNSPVRTIAFVNQRAISAGALIAMACETLIMAKGGTIGAATPVLGGAGESQPASEKSVSYVRKEFRSTAEVRNRPPQFAEAMVDEDVVIPGVVEKGKLLTLTTAEALKHDVADGSAATIEEALRVAGIENANLRRASQTWAETFVRFITNPIVSSLLMTIGMLGLLIELRTPGFALPGFIGILSLGLVFWGHWIVQLAGWEELLLVVIGLALVALEIFVIPGTTVVGIAGGIAVLAGLGMTLVGAGATVAIILAALGRVAISLLLALVGAAVLLRFLPNMPFGRQLILGTAMQSDTGYVSAPSSDRTWLGRTGTALSPMRPAGIADIDGARVDVVSDGTFIASGSRIEVVRVDGNRIVVRSLPSTKTENT